MTELYRYFKEYEWEDYAEDIGRPATSEPRWEDFLSWYAECGEWLRDYELEMSLVVH